MKPLKELVLYSRDLLDDDPLDKFINDALKKQPLDPSPPPRFFSTPIRSRSIHGRPPEDEIVHLQPKSSVSPPHQHVSRPTTAPHNKAEAFLKNTLGNITHTIGNLADLLHMSPFAFLLLCAGGIVLLICICCICGIRAKNKKVPKNYGTRVDVFDDLPLPDFMDEGCSAGIITYAIVYDMKKKVLRVRLLDANGLLAAENQPMDPYVRVSLVKPMEDEKFTISDLETIGKTFQTKIQTDTCSPVFNEVFNFKESLATVLQSWLFFNIFDFDLSGQDVNYGYVLIRLNEMDSNAFVGDTIEEAATIITSSMEIKTGDMCVILKLAVLRENEELEITLLEARDLPIPKKRGGSFFVSATLYKEGKNKKWKKKISPHIPCTGQNPYFNTTFRFSVSHGYMKGGKLVLKIIYISSTLGIRKTVGRLDFSRESETASASHHWNETNKNPLKRLPRWHTLPQSL